MVKTEVHQLRQMANEDHSPGGVVEFVVEVTQIILNEQTQLHYNYYNYYYH